LLIQCALQEDPLHCFAAVGFLFAETHMAIYIPHCFEMRVLQRSVFPQGYAQSKSNVGVFFGGGVAAAMTRK